MDELQGGYVSRRITAGYYYGSKLRHLDFILPLLPRTKVYIEPFGGSAAVLLNRPRSEVEVYSDLYPPVVCLIKTLRDDYERLIQSLEMTPYSRTEFYATYPVSKGKLLETARQMVVRMLQGVGGYAATRKNKSGWARHTRTVTKAPGSKYIRNNFTAVGKRLQGVTVLHKNALDLIPEYDSPDTVSYTHLTLPTIYSV